MIKDLTDDDNIEFGIRRHTDDKLTYKLIIAKAINECRITEGDAEKYPKAVKALVHLIYFDIRGYNLKTKIDVIVERLQIERKNMYTEEENTVERWLFYRKSYQSKLKMKIMMRYNEALFMGILQLLASEGLLMDTEKIINVAKVEEAEEIEENDEEETNE
jgi:hypothetical protein